MILSVLLRASLPNLALPTPTTRTAFPPPQLQESERETRDERGQEQQESVEEEEAVGEGCLRVRR